MTWNWQKNDWPHFRWEKPELSALESQFLRQSGVLLGVAKHINTQDKKSLIADIMTNEAVKTTEIEGEYLNRNSVQSSIRRHFGLAANQRYISPAENGIADLLTDLYHHFAKPLSHALLYQWHKMLMQGKTDLKAIGRYRSHPEPMQIVSGPIHKPKIHFEAPPSRLVKKSMDQFIAWFNQTAPTKINALPALTRAGITHLYFVSIHPFEDGNGRIARALAEKSLAQCLDQPTLIALSTTIQNQRKRYYAVLEKNNKAIEITEWLIYFAKTILHAQEYSLAAIEFLIEKAKLFERAKDQLNTRQEKVITRMFREGLEGFKGGLSAENYLCITKTSRATATRDLQDLVEKKVLRRSGELKTTRYFLNIKSNFSYS